MVEQLKVINYEPKPKPNLLPNKLANVDELLSHERSRSPRYVSTSNSFTDLEKESIY